MASPPPSTTLRDIRQQRYKYVVGMLVMACAMWVNGPSKLRSASSPTSPDNEKKANSDAAASADTAADTAYDDDTSIRIQQACRDMPESFAAFTRALHDNMELRALAEWTFSPPTNVTKDANPNNNPPHNNKAKEPQQPWFFPKLDRPLLDTAFAGKSIAIVGDSTTYYTLQWLNQLLVLSQGAHIKNSNNSNNATDDSLNRLATMNLTRAVRMADQLGFAVPPTGGGGNLDTDGIFYKQGHILWRGFHGPNVDLNCDFETNIWRDIQQQRPEILVANWGMHMLFRPRVQLCNIYQLIHYEDFFLERTLQVAKESGTKLVLFKTTNLICKNEKRILEKHQSMCNNTIHRWRDRAQADGYEYSNVSNHDLDQYYNESILLEASSRRLNERLYEFVDATRYRTDLPSDMTIAIYNDHDMESCKYTPGDDGLHFKILQMPRIRLLAHMINCLWSNNV